jgi:hypothetical protein
MIRTILKHGARLLLGAAFGVCVAPVHASSITISDSTCDSFTLTGTAPNQVLTCVVSGVPNCTVSGPSTGTIGSPITLTAQCSSSATSWRWTGGACANATTQTCSDTQSTAGTTQYTVLATNAVATGTQSAPLSVTWGATAPQAPSNCSISVSPSATLTAAGIVSLTMSCSGGAPTSYTWAGGFAAGMTSGQVSGTVSATTTFTATAANAGGSASATQSVTVSSGPPGSGVCSGFTNTRVIAIDWNNPQPVLTAGVGGVGPNDAVIVQFTTGPGANPGQFGNITGAEYSSDPSTRVAALSTRQCDFGSTLGFGATSTSNTVTVNFSVGANSSGYYPALQPNTTYYYNVKQLAGSTCASSGNCNMYFQLHKPPGL